MINILSNISTRQLYQQSNSDNGNQSGGDGVNLLEWSDFAYAGSFRLANVLVSGADPNYGGYGGMWYNAANDSVLIAGHTSYLDIIEYPIPALVDISGATPFTSANQSTALQGRRSSKTDMAPTAVPWTNATVQGSLYMYGGNIYGSWYDFYDGNASNVLGHWKMDSGTLSGASYSGLYSAGSLNAGYTCGSVMDIPANKQAKLGGYTHAFSTIHAAIVTRQSQGCNFHGFDPSDVGGVNPIPIGNYLYYPEGQNAAEFDRLSGVGGGFIPDGTNCVMYIGCKMAAGGLARYGEQFQGDPEDPDNPTTPWINDPYRPGKGYHEQQGRYTYCVWGFDLDDLEAVRLGSLHHASVVPYIFEDISLPHETNAREAGGIAYDRTNKRVFVCVPKGETIGFRRTPLIHVYTHS